MTLRVLDLFSGIGGFSLGLERTGGFETVAFCEIEPFCRRVLAKHWPEVPCYEDVRELTAAKLEADGIAVDVICGGFPCQDISAVGKGAGLDGARSGLWFEYARIIGELRPRFVVVENVAALLHRGLDRVLGSLAEIGYDAEWSVFLGTDVGVPQKRSRVWLVAYPASCGREPVLHQNALDAIRGRAGLDGSRRDHADAYNESGRAGAVPLLGDAAWPAILDGERSGTDGRLPRGLDRYRAIGNSVIPQIPELIGNAILAALRQQGREFTDASSPRANAVEALSSRQVNQSALVASRHPLEDERESVGCHSTLGAA